MLNYHFINGLFSNINVLQRVICHHLEANINITNINLQLLEYYNLDEINIFNKLFQINKKNDINLTDCKYILNNCLCSVEGLFNKHVDLTIVNKIRNNYLCYSNNIIDKYNNFIETKKYIYIYYRATDKINENTIPDYQSFCNFIINKNVNNLKIYLKTDSLLFLNYFQTRFNNYTFLEDLVIDEEPKHLNLYHILDNDFYLKYGIYKWEHLQNLLFYTMIASKSEMYIATNSNINSWIIQQRGNFNNVFIFKNNVDLLY